MEFASDLAPFIKKDRDKSTAAIAMQ
ncbi:uncharacterized protein METZ01_LOCUS119180 [marine metagenome]|uniref:Uncharacterized protein n=1 Tax=marine metagenome TaxID=408172 RepID=A0A381XNG8_9ZZZZ